MLISCGTHLLSFFLLIIYAFYTWNDVLLPQICNFFWRSASTFPLEIHIAYCQFPELYEYKLGLGNFQLSSSVLSDLNFMDPPLYCLCLGRHLHIGKCHCRSMFKVYTDKFPEVGNHNLLYRIWWTELTKKIYAQLFLDLAESQHASSGSGVA